MKKLVVHAWLAVLVAGLSAAPAAAAADESVVQEVLGILKERGMLDESRYTELMTRNEAYEAEQKSLLDRVSFSGDLRGRFENFWYEQDAFNNTPDNRTRIRYRLRLKGEAEVNEWFNAVFMLASGEDDPRSTNRTLGKSTDFSPDPIFISQAYIDMHVPTRLLPETMTLTSQFGRVENPFRQGIGKDLFIWDPDITPAGVSVETSIAPWENTRFFMNTGFYVLQENSSAKDPLVYGVQGGGSLRPSEGWELGGRLSWYGFQSLNSSVLNLQFQNGNTPGLTDGAPNTQNDGVNVGDLLAYARFSGIDEWPILVYGELVHNFSARSNSGAGKDDLGWMVGTEVGDKKAFALFGFGWYYAQANYSMAQFTDSDLFDGLTNRKGLMAYITRTIMKNTEVTVTLFRSWDIDSQLPLYTQSVGGAERYRLQTDLMIKF